MIEIVPTYVPRDAEDLALGAEKIRVLASSIHVDVDDGILAPVLTWPYLSSGSFEPFNLATLAALDVEVHLMVSQPREIGIAFARAGAMRIIGHIEGFKDASEARSALDAWRAAGASEVGLGLLLSTPFDAIGPVVPACDVIHMMSIATIGTQGIPYDSSAPERIAQFHVKFPEVKISVDGGVSESNIAELVRSGATRFGVGSAISKASDPKSAYERLKALAESATER